MCRSVLSCRLWRKSKAWAALDLKRCRPCRSSLMPAVHLSTLVSVPSSVSGWCWLEHDLYFSIYWECHHPNWLIFVQRGWNHQPEIQSRSFLLFFSRLFPFDHQICSNNPVFIVQSHFLWVLTSTDGVRIYLPHFQLDFSRLETLCTMFKTCFTLW